MVFSDPFPRTSRLTAVLGPPRPRPPIAPPGSWAAAEPSTVPIPIDEQPAAAEPTGTGLDGPASGEDGGGARWRARALLDRCWPATWRSARVDPGRPGATALALVAVAAALLAAVGVWAERPQAQSVGGLPRVSGPDGPAVAGNPGAGPASTGGAGPLSGPALGPDRAGAVGPAAVGADTATTPPPPAAPLVVSVSGKVHRPGLVEVPSGARVADALAAAGGPLPGTDLSQLNLARRVADGEQVAVGVPAAPDAGAPLPGPAGSPTVPGAAATSVPGARLDLNAATVAQLDGLPGVGPVTAQRILDWRTRNGRFAQVEQLREIEGIGERRFGQLRELVTV